MMFIKFNYTKWQQDLNEVIISALEVTTIVFINESDSRRMKIGILISSLSSNIK